MARAAAVLCALMATSLVPGPPAEAVAAAQGPIRPEQFHMGIASHLGDRKPRLSDGKLDGEIALTDLGATTLRDEAGWDHMDDPGWADALKLVPQNGGKIMLLLDYGNPKYLEGGPFPDTPGERKAFLQYARALVTKVGPKNLVGIEVWNEWDVYMGWGGQYQWNDPCPIDASDAPGCPLVYAQLVESLLHPEREGLGVPSLRQAAPGVPIVVNAIGARDAPWTAAVMSRLRERKVQVDGAVLHPYVSAGNGCPGSSRRPPAGPRVAANCVRLVADEVASAYGQRLPIYVTEVGWSSYDGPGGVSEDVQARNLVEFYVRARATGDTAGIWWYDLVEDVRPDDAEEEHFGLIRRDPADRGRPGQTKPAGHAYGALAHFWAGCTDIDGAFQGNRTFDLSCPDGDRQIVLSATQAELEAAVADGHTVVDLLAQQPAVGPGGEVSALVGHPVGVRIGAAEPEIGDALVVVVTPTDAPAGRSGPNVGVVLANRWVPPVVAGGVALGCSLAGFLLWRRLHD